MADTNELKQRLREQRDLLNELQSTRLHRALSWLNAAYQHEADAEQRVVAYNREWRRHYKNHRKSKKS